MAFGVTTTGYVRKRLIDIQDETTQAFKDAFGDGFDLDARNPAGQIKNILDERISLIHELLEAVYFSEFPDTAEGANLDQVVALTGIAREAATKSISQENRVFGTLATAIPLGTIYSVTGSPTSRFISDCRNFDYQCRSK